MNATLARALELCDSPGAPGVDPLTQLRSRRAAMTGAMDAILRVPNVEQRNLLASEGRDFDRAVDRIRGLDERIEEIEATQTRSAHAADTTRMSGMSGLQSAYVTDPATYAKGNSAGPSFFRDLADARSGHGDAIGRLQRNNTEQRALGNSGGAGGAGGEFAPPAWILELYVRLARPGRVVADRCTRQPLPAGVSSVNIPRVATGTSTAVQVLQNTAVSQTDLTTTALSAPIVTVAGRAIVSRQLIDQSGLDLDLVILGDLAADAAKQVDLQVISGTGAGGQVTGILNVAGITQVAYTQATPAVAGAGGFYSTLNKAIAAIATARYAPPDCILMHPRRWSWTAAAFDGANRPLVSPSGNAFNQVAASDNVDAEGPVGQMAGLAVYLDANIPTNLGAGTNQDPVIVGRFSDLFLWESPMNMQVFEQPYADSMGVLYRAHEYLSFQGARYPASIAVVNGTGTVSPVY